MQGNHLIVYANHVLTDPKTCYVQIKKELLAFIYGLEKFHPYKYARQVIGESDDKPSEVIIKTPLH